MQVILNKRHKRRRSLLRLFFRLLLLGLVFAAAGGVALMSYAKMQGPPPLSVAQTTEIIANDGAIISQSHQGNTRRFISVHEISPYLVHATLAIEDRKFYDHLGFDPVRIGGAVVANLRSGARSQGASTITQQYAKNLYLTSEKTWIRKWNELIYSLRLEMNYEKDQILEGYLNTIYYGHGAYGIEAAANYYFSKSSKDLTLAEASMLAGIPKGPSHYSPTSEENMERAINRQSTILTIMVDEGYISQEEAIEAKNTELEYTRQSLTEEISIARYFQDIVMKRLVSDAGLSQDRIDAGGLRIYTTLDPKMQREAEYWVEKEMPPLANRTLTEKEKQTQLLQTGLVAMDPRTGEVKALIGGVDYGVSEFNRAEAGRHPGSAFKPFLYYAALENGSTPASTLFSEATEFDLGEDGPYPVTNFNQRHADDFITLLEAIAFSDNVYAVKTNLMLGVEKLQEVVKRVGIESPLHNHASLALGTANVSLIEMARGYSAFANGGYNVTPRFIKKVVDLNGKVLYESPYERELVLDPKLAFIMTDLMRGMFEPELSSHATVTGNSVAHLVNRPIAGKSGSTKHDSYMVGFTPQLVTSVWVGYDKTTEITHSTEGNISKRIWANFTEHALKDELKLDFMKPKGVVGVEMNPHSGYLASETCPKSRLTYFVEGTEPVSTCPPSEDNDGTNIIEEEEHREEKFIERFIRRFTGQ